MNKYDRKDLTKNLLKYCENQYIDSITTQAANLIFELVDELEWVYSNSNEQHVIGRMAKICPPEER